MNMVPTSPDSDATSKKRIRIACDTCRRKKIKCNGQQPCSNCVSVGESNCHYEDRPVKKKHSGDSKRSTRQYSNSQELHLINSRLAGLEGVLSTLVSRLDTLAGVKPTQAINFTPGAAYTNEETDDEDDDDDDAYPDTPEEVATKDDKDKKPKDSSQAFNSKSLEQYFGTHSIMCIFSNKSLDWIEQTIGPEGPALTLPIKNIPLVFVEKLKQHLLKWVDPVPVDHKARKRLLESPFPSDSRLVFDFLDAYYTDIPMITLAADPKIVRKLFEDYYKNFEPETKVKRKIKFSEYMMMSTALMICISVKLNQKIDCETMGPTASACIKPLDPSSPVHSATYESLLQLQNTCFDNTVYYYHRISVVRDGLETIEAILALVIFIEGNFLTSHVNYILIGVAVRYAQEMGLHRAETLESLSNEEQDRRRKLWWLCQYYDMEICFRSGKPPLINAADVTTNTAEDLQNVSKSGREPTGECGTCNLETFGTSAHLAEVSQQGDLRMLYYIYLLLLTKIRAKSYTALFSASVQNDSYETLASKLQCLNDEMFELAASMKDYEKPRFFNDPEFKPMPDDMSIDRRATLVAMHLSYFLHLMLMNRLAFIVNTNADDIVYDQNLKFRNISLNAARTILILVKQINRSNTPASFFKWIIFFPVSAFLNISAALLNNPEAPEAYNDLQLLIDSSMNFFGATHWFKLEKEFPDLYSQKDAVLMLLIKLMLRVDIRFYETKMGVSILANNEKLRQHLEEVKEAFPEVFTGNKLGERPSMVYGASPFSHKNSSNVTPGSRSDTGSSSSAGRVSAAHSPSTHPSLSNILHPPNDSIAKHEPRSDLNGQTPLYTQSTPHPVSTTSTSWAFPPSSAFNTTPKSASSTHPLGQSPWNAVNNGMSRYAVSGNNFQEGERTVRSRNASGSNTSTSPHADMFGDYLNDDALTSMFFSQMDSLPNFFFDNNVGVEH